MPPDEAKNLEAHVAACSERYKTIFNRLGRIEAVLWSGIGGLVLGMGTVIVLLIQIITNA